MATLLGEVPVRGSDAASTRDVGTDDFLRAGSSRRDGKGLSERSALHRFGRSQSLNAVRHARLVRRLDPADFGTGPAAPKRANVEAVNALLSEANARQRVTVRALVERGERASRKPNRAHLAAFLRAKDAAGRATRDTEKIWLFYEALFAQRAGPFAEQLAAMDRIALDCYQACYMGLGAARSLPTPPPMAFVESGYGPATYRRGVRVTRIGRRANPFPLVKLPYHRLVNPWSLGAVPHEIGHNLQNDLGLWQRVPQLMGRRLSSAGLPPDVVRTWQRWHKEVYADVIGVLLIGPAFATSLMDVIGKPPARVATFSPTGVHPTSYLRLFITTALLRRIGFAREAASYEGAWRRLYPPSSVAGLPDALRSTFPRAVRLTLDAIAFTSDAAYGGRSLAQVVRFRPQDQQVVEEAAGRLAQGRNPGIAPERFLIPAVRRALERRLAPAEVLTRNFYTALGRG